MLRVLWERVLLRREAGAVSERESLRALVLQHLWLLWLRVRVQLLEGVLP